jgi:hypothetical protein
MPPPRRGRRGHGDDGRTGDVRAAPAAPPASGGRTATPARRRHHGRGFLITLTGTTPHAEPAAFLQDTVVIKNLEALLVEKLPKDKR